MVLRLILVNLMNRDGSVDNRRLDCLFLDDWLNSLESYVIITLELQISHLLRGHGDERAPQR